MVEQLRSIENDADLDEVNSRLSPSSALHRTEALMAILCIWWTYVQAIGRLSRGEMSYEELAKGTQSMDSELQAIVGKAQASMSLRGGTPAEGSKTITPEEG